MEQNLSIEELRIDVQKRFGKDARSSYFGITDIKIRSPRGENISFLLQHYSSDTVLYKIFFNTFISFEIRDEMLAQEKNVQDIRFDEDYNGIIIHRILDGVYLNFLRTALSLKLFDDMGYLSRKEIQQYSIYEQNFVVDIVTISPPDIILIED